MTFEQAPISFEYLRNAAQVGLNFIELLYSVTTSIRQAVGWWPTKRKPGAYARNRLLRIAAFQNPEFYKAHAMRLSTPRQAARHRMRRRFTSAPGLASRLPD